MRLAPHTVCIITMNTQRRKESVLFQKRIRFPTRSIAPKDPPSIFMIKKKSDGVGKGKLSTQLQEAIRTPNKEKMFMRSQKTPSRTVFDAVFITIPFPKKELFAYHYHRIKREILSMMLCLVKSAYICDW